jgi:hypothetical protein
MKYALKYELLLFVFKFALIGETVFIKLRDWAQRNKMKCIKEVPTNWESMQSW